MPGLYKVYMHTSPSGKKYIGITRQELKKRFGYNGNGYRKNPIFYNAIKKYGWDNITHELLFDGLTKEEAENMEIILIRSYRSNEKAYGYNVDNGGNCCGTHSEETKKKISDGNKGRTFSEESKRKMSESHKGKGCGADNYWYGKHLPKRIKEMHSEFMRGNQYNKGHHHTDEFKKWKSAQMHEAYSNGGNPRCKAVCGYDEEGNLKERYFSLREAARNKGISPGNLCSKIKKQEKVFGLIWRYES